MNLNNKIEDVFYPELYTRRISEDECHGVTLINGAGLSRYAIHIQSYNPDLSMKEQIEHARNIIFKRTKAYWLFREVGACIVFSAPQLPLLDIDSLGIDKSGFHAVIIQGVHVFSESGESLYNQSKWFNRTFGKSQDVLKALAACDM